MSDPPNLHRKIERIRAAYRHCRICPRDCGVDRTSGAGGAFCGLDERAWVYKELLSYGEESLLGPTWLLDLGGCSMRCLFCTEWTHVVTPRATPAGLLDADWFAARCRQRRAAGARTISFVGGDPTVSLLAILEAIAAVDPDDRLPLIWNCNGWTSPLVRDVLADVVDCWLIDLKFATNSCADRLAGTAGLGYREAVDATLDAVHAPAKDGLPRLLIRHLVMPEHIDCCTRPVIADIARRWPDATLNLMTTYLPFGPAQRPLGTATELAGLNNGGAVQDAIAAAMGSAQDRPEQLLIDGKPAFAGR